MAKALRLEIPQPCHENWQAMTPAEQGRHCAACDKVVLDFTTMTEAEIKAFFAQRPTNTCGRLRTDQLRTYTLPTQGFRIGWRPALAAISLGLSAVLAYPTVTMSQTPTEQLATDTMDNDTPKTNIPSDTLRLRGRVLGKGENFLPISQARVVVMNTELLASTDQDGFFDLAIPTELQRPETSIAFKHPHYSAQEFTFAELQKQMIIGDGVHIVLPSKYSEVSEPAFNISQLAHAMGSIVVGVKVTPTNDFFSRDYLINRLWK